MTRKSRYSRRTFLAGLGLGPGLLPLLDVDFARAGCLAKPPKRLIALVWTNGQVENFGGSGAGFTLPGSMKSLAAYKSDIIPIRGVRLQTLKDTPNPKNADNAGHGATPALLTGRQYGVLEPLKENGGGPSIDAFVGAALQKKGVNVPRATLNLGVGTKTYIATWRAANERAQPDNDPFHVFDTIYGGASSGTDVNAAKWKAVRGSILDLVKDDLTVFKTRVGTESAMRIDAHLTSVRELEQNLMAMPGGAAGMAGSINGCAPPALGPPIESTLENFDKITKAQIDLAVGALAADVTRAVTIQIGNESNGNTIPTWLGFNKTGDTSSGVGDSNAMHAIAHRGGADKIKLDTWYQEQFAYLIGRLKNEKEGDGSSVLDNSVVVVANHMDTGGGHGTDNIPWLLAGRCQGYFKTGQGLVVGNVSHTAVLKEIIKAMGVDPSGFFQPQYDMDLPGLRA